jgi:LAO/AO transport system kinase
MPTMSQRRNLSLAEYVEGILSYDRMIIGRAITLVESKQPTHRHLAQQLLGEILTATGKSHRVGISGVPGVGKSTFIERLGMMLLEQQHRVAVLAIDPSSSVRGGSIMGDKTRMPKLAADQRAFIRPSPSQGYLGGVHRNTRETMLICEAAGFDVILVETVGVGQSEIAVADLVDTFVLLQLAGAGDELQGIKKGIIEIADIIAINKADGANQLSAQRACAEYRHALQILTPADSAWKKSVLTCSSTEGIGISELWEEIKVHRRTLIDNGELQTKRQDQRRKWLWSMVEWELLEHLRKHPDVVSIANELEKEVVFGQMPPSLAAEQILKAFGLCFSQ